MKTHTTFARTLRLAGVAGALGLAASLLPSARADFDVHVNLGAPPPPRVEHYEMRDRPGPDYVWVKGYWAGEPGHYRWVAGRWERPAYPGAVWVEPRWERHGDRYEFVQGRWDRHDRDDRRDDHDHDRR